jgi:hypothetical protein
MFECGRFAMPPSRTRDSRRSWDVRPASEWVWPNASNADRIGEVLLQTRRWMRRPSDVRLTLRARPSCSVRSR